MSNKALNKSNTDVELTTTQDILEYMSPSYKDNPTVDAVILQAPVADRGALEIDMGREALDESVKLAKELIDLGRGSERIPKDRIVPLFPPISAQRWYALAAVE